MISDPESVLRATEAELRRVSFREFVTQVRPGYRWYRHCEVLADVLQRVADGEIRRLMIFMPPRHGKPVYNGSMILLDTGERKPISEIKPGDRVITHLGRSRPVLAVHDQGNLPTLTITTVAGRTTIAAHDHPFLTPDGWKRADELRPGMSLANVPNPECPGSENRPAEEFRLAGYFIGDGHTAWTSKGKSFAANITCFDPIEAEDLKVCAAKMGFGIPAVEPGRYPFTGGVRPWLRDSELAGKTSRHKRVPSWVFRGSPEQIGHFVGAYFSCDGHINARGGARKDACVEFYSVNRALLKDVQHLLLRLGIESRIRLKVVRYKGNPVDNWRLAITSQDAAARFASKVPLVSVKAARLKEWGLIRTKFDGPLLADPIVHIGDSGPLPCRCLTVEEDHTFTSDDLVVHNSELASRLFPAYWLYRFPTQWAGLCSWGATLAEDLSRDARNNYVRGGGVLAGDASSVSHWKTGAGGGMWAAGIGGGILGKGWHLGVIDDPIKDAIEAFSERSIATLHDWYDSTFSSREEPDVETGRPDGALVNIQQRWSDNDLAGWLLSRESGGGGDEDDDDSPERWHIVNFEAIKEEAPFEAPPTCTLEPDWRRPGEALCPERRPIEKLLRIRLRNPFYFSALYQQRPAPREGALFEPQWFRVVDAAPAKLKLVRYFDTAGAAPGKGDYSVGVLMGRDDDGYFWLLDVVRGQWAANDRNTLIRATAEADRQQYGRVKCYVEQPPGLAKESTEAIVRLLAGFSVEGDPVHRDKVGRAEPFSAQCRAGNVRMLRGRWNRAYLDEMAGFPFGKHDDQVDASSGAFNKLSAGSKGACMIDVPAPD